MIKQQTASFVLRWLVSSTGMWLCIMLFGNLVSPYDPWIFITAGLIFSLVNSIIKPIVTILSLPLIITTLGFFILVVNTAMVALTIWIIPGVSMGFWGAVFSSILMSAINALVNSSASGYNKR